MVKHVGRDGQEHLYSSKPPLLATLMAGPYWLVHKTTGATLATHPYEIGRGMLVLWNVDSAGHLFLSWRSLAERFGTTDWGRLFMMAGATFGTFLTTFAVSINNHVLAAVGCRDGALGLRADRLRRPARAAVLCAGRSGGGLHGGQRAAGLGAALPVGRWRCLYGAPRQTLLAFLPAALVVVAAHFGTNYLAHDTLREPYSHWNDWYKYHLRDQRQSARQLLERPAGHRSRASPIRRSMRCTRPLAITAFFRSRRCGC